MAEENEKFLTIDGVQINADELSEKAKQIVARLHVLANERNAFAEALQERNILITAYRNQLVLDYQKVEIDKEKQEEDKTDKTVKKSNN